MDGTPITMKQVATIGLPILLGICAGVSYISSNVSKVSALSDRVGVIEVRQQNFDKDFNDLKNNVIEIKAILNERLPAKNQ